MRLSAAPRRRERFADALGERHVSGMLATLGRFGRDDQGKVRDTGLYTFFEESPTAKGYFYCPRVGVVAS